MSVSMLLFVCEPAGYNREVSHMKSGCVGGLNHCTELELHEAHVPRANINVK